MTPAGILPRWIAMMIDILLLGFVAWLLQAVAGIHIIGEAQVFGLGGSAAAIIVSWLYFALFEGSSKQATPGKQLMGMKVVTRDGSRPDFGTASLRYFSKLLSAFILFIGYIMALFTDRKQALHDKIAGTLVVRGS